ncbi:hypothetical protein [Flavobacterium quisquiliarum]|uniref:3-keto-disaccharide hydrolase domain-containing protein n=1 Tax=Flavobacterium quisquiliarum TaxID=1834436 RepID=A0ABV8W311_9FLAO|nr:hypothetical protein [Flavobacterium quisquiliarum]MBW1653982.1 hypothetical protein [Flavobacterium quisquiliarum]
MKNSTRSALMFTLILLPCLLFGQQQQTIELADLYKKGKLKPVNREVKIVSSDSGAYLKIAQSKKEGLVWLPFKDFKNGTIEIQMRGKDVFQRSFIGIAFHRADDSTYDAVYCRPFNFSAKDSIRRIHAVQYISHPDFTWDRLRKQSNAVFEKEIINPPDPNGWFTMKLVIEGATVKAFINNAAQPSLTVQKLSSASQGKIGLFTADSSGGDFKTMRINYKN